MNYSDRMVIASRSLLDIADSSDLRSTAPANPQPEGSDAALRAIVEGVEAETGDRFFSSLARSLALALGVQYAFVTRLSDEGRHFKVLALWERDHFGENIE